MRRVISRLYAISENWSQWVSLGLIVLFAVVMGLEIWELSDPLFPDFADHAIWLDVAFRVYKGQIPHLDFTSTIGPGIPLFLGFALKLLGPSTKSIGIVTISFFVGILCFYFLRTRKSKSLYLIIGLTCSAFIYLTNPILNYNEFGWFFLCLTIVESHLAREESEHNMTLGGAFFGSLLFFMLTLKYIFFIYSVCLLLGLGILCPPKRRWLIAVFLGFMTMFLITGILINFEFSKAFHDISISMHVRGDLVKKDFLSFKIHKRFFHKYIWGILLFFVPAAWVNWQNNKIKFSWLVGLLPAIFVLQNAVILSGSNWPKPYAKVWLLFILFESLVTIKNIKPVKYFKYLYIFSIISFLTLGLQGIVEHHILYSHKLFVLGNMTKKSRCTGAYIPYPCLIEDGLKGIDQVAGDRMGYKVFALSYSNPFNILHRTAGPLHDLSHWSFSDSFSLDEHPRPEVIFRDAEFVMEPKAYASAFEEQSGELMKKIFMPAVKNNYELVVSTDYWNVWGK